MKRTLIVVVMGWSALVSSIWAQESNPTSHSTVCVQLLDPEGYPLKEGVTTFSAGARRFDVRPGCTDQIPFGLYTLTTITSGTALDVRTLFVDRPKIYLTIGLRLGLVGGVEGGGVPVKGRLLSKDRFAFGVWLRLTNIFTGQSFETVLRQDRTFDFGGVPPGPFVLVCVSGPKVLVVRRLDVSPAVENVGIELELQPDVTLKP